jgi:multimeric flavodoxin WrbA
MDIKKPRVLGLAASPRRGGNSEALLDAFLATSAAGGAECEKIVLVTESIGPCVACEDCYATGRCCIADDADALFAKLLAADIVVFATPIYFYAIPAQAKNAIDRCQVLWARQAKLGQRRSVSRSRGVLIATAASGGQRLFEGAVLTVKYWMDTFFADLQTVCAYRGLDQRTDVGSRPEIVAEVEAAARALVIDRPKK